jgi:hypothetical protein
MINKFSKQIVKVSSVYLSRYVAHLLLIGKETLKDRTELVTLISFYQNIEPSIIKSKQTKMKLLKIFNRRLFLNLKVVSNVE